MTALFVPNSRMTWTTAMRQNSGMRHANASQSSLNSLSVLIYLPETRNKIMTAAKMVHHQQTNNVALSSRKERAGGGSLYTPISSRLRLPAPVYLRRGDERGAEGIRDRVRSGILVILDLTERIPVGSSRIVKIRVSSAPSHRLWHDRTRGFYHVSRTGLLTFGSER